MEYSKVANYLEKIANNPKRLAKTKYLSELLKETPKESLNSMMLLLRGNIFPDWDEREIGMSSNLILKSIAITTGKSTDNLKEEWKKIGDIGSLAQEIISSKTQSTLFNKKNTVNEVIESLQGLAGQIGQGSVDRKIKTISSLLSSCTPLEAKYIARAALQDLRIGVSDGTIRDSLIWAFVDDLKMVYEPDQEKLDYSAQGAREQYVEMQDVLQSAIDKTNDFGKLARILKKKEFHELKAIKIEHGKPFKVMLAQKSSKISDAIEKVGTPAAVEQKKDGFRVQIHKINQKVKIFTRSLDNVTEQFPEIILNIRKFVKLDNCIIDAEAVGYDFETKKYMPFQSISQRIKRKHNIKKLSEKYPVEIFAFDLIAKGNEIINLPFKQRRQLLEDAIIETDYKIRLIKQIKSSDAQQIKKFYEEALLEGNEGIMIKNNESPYKPGSRTGHMIKMKPSMDEMDLVIVGAEWGTGKRSGWLTSFKLACKHENKYLEIGKVGTGLKEKGEGLTFNQLTELLKPLITKENAREVQITPKILIEVRFEEIQKSSAYSSGYALRFPRVIRLREDKKEITTLAEVKKAYEDQ